MENELDIIFAAMCRLKDLEFEIHRLKNSLEMMNRSNKAKKEWVGLSDEEIAILWKASPLITGVYYYTDIAREVEAKLREKNNG